jgi:hypothetical protein
VYDYEGRNHLLLGHLVVITYQTPACVQIQSVQVYSLFKNEDSSRLYPAQWFGSEILVEAYQDNWDKIKVIIKMPGNRSSHPISGMNKNQTTKRDIWRGELYAFPASKTDDMREFLRELFA